MKKILIAIVCLIILLSYSSVKAAGTPSIVSYQGRLADSSGNLLGGSGTTYYFKFSIWDASTVGSGTKLWPTAAPTATTLTVRDGVFNVNIGDTGSGYPDTLNYNFNTNKNVYLQIEVSSNGSSFETMSPRQRISSAPFAQVSGSVSGTDQSSFGTTTPVSNAVVTIEATSTSSIGALIRASLGQIASLFRLEDSSGNHLFSVNALGGIFGSSTLAIGSTTTSFIVNSSGNVGVGTGAPSRKLNVVDANSAAQLRLSQTSSEYGELYTDSTGDVQVYSTGGNIRMQDENAWVCSGGSCGATAPVGKGNIVVENAVILNNNFKLKQTDASTTIMYDSANNSILEFDEGQ